MTMNKTIKGTEIKLPDVTLYYYDEKAKEIRSGKPIGIYYETRDIDYDKCILVIKYQIGHYSDNPFVSECFEKREDCEKYVLELFTSGIKK